MIPQKSLVINCTDKTNQVITLQDPEILGPMDYGIKEYEKGEEYVIFGMGLLAGSNIPGTHRMIVVAHSKLWEHYYDSTMGGAAYIMLRLGVNYLHIKGRLPEHSVLKINNKAGQLHVAFEPVNPEEVWKGYQNERGFYALQQHIYDKYHEEFKACRVIATGPAALHTRAGALGSAPIEHDKITPVDCWAGRGGMGSQLLQNHGIAGIIYGGDEPIKNPALTDRAKIDSLFEAEFGKKMVAEDLVATKKYRYDEEFHSGGTLGVNFTKLKGEMFSFNYRSNLWTEEQRVAIHQKYIIEHYIKQFNEETIEPKAFKHCGEPCPAACKKMRDKFKKDYEPYQTLGPLSGIFDQRAAELANHHADMLGVDAIQIGVYVAWIMDCLDSKVFPKEAFGLTKDPKFNPDNFDVVMDSMHNAELAVEIMNMIMYSEHSSIFKDGIRVAAKRLAQTYGDKAQHLATYNAHGAEGCMAPNQYWTPGMYSPMPLMGKYCTSYGGDYMEPQGIGKKNVERMVFELYSDNGGLCRFHRKWIEQILPKLVNTLYNENIDYKQHHERLAKRINKKNDAVFWETEKIIDLIHGYLKRQVTKHPEAQNWVDKFNNDKWAAAHAYWEAIKQGQEEAFNALPG
ncbi:aldehyde ferredoxin oxidoreductase [Candidatus Woesearchaeota archaeon]|nr:aldehyde ferredoxin oxidoreductase [Candidatus Woesearchaeota archaeon]